MSPEFEMDPERKLWKPNRRGFLSMFSAAIVASVLPDLPIERIIKVRLPPRFLVDPNFIARPFDPMQVIAQKYIQRADEYENTGMFITEWGNA